eukprot:s725_g2.t1
MPTPSAERVSFAPDQLRYPSVSRSFQTILDKLVEQHVAEIASYDRSSARADEPPSQNVTSARIELPHQESPRGSGSQISFRGFSHAGSQMSLMTGNGSHGGLANKFRTRCMREKRRSVHSVDASQVLEALHDNETDVEHFFRTTDSIERIFKDLEPDFIDVVHESKFTRFDSEYNRMSCYEKLRFWLQSHKFDFLITAFLCLNVIFMGFELQFSGSVTAAYPKVSISVPVLVLGRPELCSEE